MGYGQDVGGKRKVWTEPREVHFISSVRRDTGPGTRTIVDRCGCPFRLSVPAKRKRPPGLELTNGTEAVRSMHPHSGGRCGMMMLLFNKHTIMGNNYSSPFLVPFLSSCRFLQNWGLVWVSNDHVTIKTYCLISCALLSETWIVA